MLLVYSFFEVKLFSLSILLLVLSQILKVIVVVIPVLLSVAYLTLFERKVMASMQRRRGPNVVGLFGLFQPLADGLKLMAKETVIPAQSNRIIFIISPVIIFFLALLGWFVIPFGFGSVYADVELGILFFFAVSSLSVYGIIIAG